MSDLKQQLERALDTATKAAAPQVDDFHRFVRYRDRRHRNKRLAAGAVALVLAAAAIGSALGALRASETRQPAGSGSLELDPGINQACGPDDPCWDADVYVMRTDGTEVVRLGYDAARDFAYSWSSDGSRVAFYHAERVEGGERFDAKVDIFTMAADGTDVRRLTDDAPPDLFPVFSPDGTKIAFTSDRAGTFDIHVMDADGSNIERVTRFANDHLADYHATWSPDGSQIAFVRGTIPPGGPGKLWVIDADGSNGHVLLGEPIGDFPMWSPDGTRIAFGTGSWPDVRVGILDLASGTVTDLIDGFQPKWSPDSTKLLVSISQGTGGFGIVDLDAPTRIQVLRWTGWAAAWSPDGAHILFNDAGLTSSNGLPAPAVGGAIAGFTESGIPFLVVRHSDGSLTAVEAVSPHLAAGNVRKILGWCSSSRTFDDPFHGARFDEFGRYVSGPSPSGLVPLSIEIVTQEPLRFRLGDPMPPLPRSSTGARPTGPLCMDLTATPLVAPDIAESGLTPEELAASSLPAGSLMSVEGTLLVTPEGEAHLCAEILDGLCEAGALVRGLVPDSEDLIVDGVWFVVVEDGGLVDPIWALPGAQIALPA